MKFTSNKKATSNMRMTSNMKKTSKETKQTQIDQTYQTKTSKPTKQNLQIYQTKTTITDKHMSALRLHVTFMSETSKPPAEARFSKGPIGPPKFFYKYFTWKTWRATDCTVLSSPSIQYSAWTFLRIPWGVACQICGCTSQ